MSGTTDWLNLRDDEGPPERMREAETLARRIRQAMDGPTGGKKGSGFVCVQWAEMNRWAGEVLALSAPPSQLPTCPTCGETGPDHLDPADDYAGSFEARCGDEWHDAAVDSRPSLDLTDLSRARGLALSLASAPDTMRPDGVREIGHEIADLLRAELARRQGTGQ